MKSADECNDHQHQITFAGAGDPLLALSVLCESATVLSKDYRIRVVTNGCHHEAFAGQLARAGIFKVTVCLNAHDENTWKIIMKPMLSSLRFEMVEAFVKSCLKHHMDVEIACVAHPLVDIAKAHTLAQSWGAGFRERQYFP
jgi:wyosine [tRNA(Phe)-imidazoG37] synthetase (radical SAM superfamily)